MPSTQLRLALVQMACAEDPQENIGAARRVIRTASRHGADLCVLPELFTNRYIGQFEDVGIRLGRVPDHHALVGDFRGLARDLSMALVVPFLEAEGPGAVFNSVVAIDRHGTVRGHYRKLHIPRSEGYREDLYFRPGDKGYVVASLDGLRLGLAICWDQWFPEVARALALQGAQLITYPSAIGSEVVAPDFDSRPSWELVMRGHAVTNRAFVAAANRVGQEERIRFYGGSFVADPWGRVIERASTARAGVLHATLDLTQISKANSFFGFFDTRRPDTYNILTKEVALKDA